ncbi:MAG: S1C family serine protease [Planctomycetota bacterium]|jgi:serine protease Do
MDIDCGKTIRRVGRAALGCSLAMLAFPWPAWAQDVAPITPSAPSEAGEVRSARKIPMVDVESSGGMASGVTYVSVEPGIDRLLQGAEPRDLAELKALQKQQSKVAERIDQVTVNLQHGNTQGSGVLIHPDGYILTAAHVAGRPKQTIWILLHDGRRVEGISMGVNRDNDAGLVRILQPRDEKGQPWPHATLPTADEQPRVGQWCIAGGHPGGWVQDRPSVIRVGRVLRIIDSTIVTDCSLIGGDSGGPLFDLQGKLIGIHSRIGVDVDDNMHVPMRVFIESWDRLANNEAWGTLPGFKPVIGVTAARNSDTTVECVIGSVSPNGPAAQAGIQTGDRITRFNGNPIDSFDRLKEEVDATVPGERVSVEIERGGQRKMLRLVVGVLDPP